MIGVAVIYYGILYGIIRKEITYTTRAGNVGTVKTYMAVIFGSIYSGFGVTLLRLAIIIFRSK